MKKYIIFLFCFLYSFIGNSQVSYYTFSETTGTYTSIVGGTQLVTTTGGATSHDTDGNSITLPSSSQFIFNGTTITTVYMMSDGYLWLNPSITLANTTGVNATTGPILSGKSSIGVISSMGMDLRSTAIASQVYERRWEDTGTEVVFQWQNAARFGQSSVERFSFQIRVTKSTGVIKIVYGNMTTIAGGNPQYVPMIGLRGTVNTDFNNRRLTNSQPDGTPNWGAPNGTTAGTSNANTVRFTSNGSCFPSSGLTFIWTPPAVPSNDACSNATSLSVQCPGSSTGTNGTTIGSITTDGLPNPSCDVTGTIRDVWYSFTTGNDTEVNLYATLGTATWIGVEIYTSCGILATGLNTNCDFNIITPNPTNITGLSMNTTYRLRVFTNVTYDTPGTFTIYLNTVNNTSTLSSSVGTDNQTLCQNTSITNITYNTKGATGSTFSGLPTGVSGSWNSNVVTITGTPSVSGTFNYVVTLTGGCGSVISNGTITVNPTVNSISLITGNLNIIAGTTENYSIPSDPNATTYQWDYRESSTSSWVTNVSSTNSASIAWPTTTTDGEVLVTVSNSCNTVNKNLLITVDGVLPVELLYFEGSSYPSFNSLIWSTASEHNSNYFQIERSIDGEEWKSVGIKSASGNSTVVIKYSHLDSFDDFVIHYYRLKQVDYDGQFKIYGPISLDNTKSFKKVIMYTNLLGQEVNSYTKGFLIEVYEDGTMKKIIR